jgi:hypothetical protein
MRLFFSSLFILLFFNVFSQENNNIENTSAVKIDSLYREDQFYLGFTFNTLQNKKSAVSQNKLSTALFFGFLRDMPVNKKRTLAIAPGIGLAYNHYAQNLGITEENQTLTYSILDSGDDYSKNKFSQLLVEMPVEFRWRSSTYQSYKFWRVYGGVKLSYLLYDRYVYKDNQGKRIITANKDFNDLLYGLYLGSGFNTINIYAYYGLNSIFKSAYVEGKKVDMNALNIGVIFYVL